MIAFVILLLGLAIVVLYALPSINNTPLDPFEKVRKDRQDKINNEVIKLMTELNMDEHLAHRAIEAKFYKESTAAYEASH